MRGDRDQCGFVRDEALGEHAVELRAGRAGDFRRRGRAVDPAREIRVDHAIAGLEARDVAADLDHFAGAVRDGNQRCVADADVVAAREHQVAIVQRYRVDLHDDVGRSDRPVRRIDAAKSGEAVARCLLPCLHVDSLFVNVRTIIVLLDGTH